MKRRFGLGGLLILLALSVQGEEPADGRSLIEASLLRHAQPSHLYEEQSLILTDRQGQHTVRTTRHYALFDGQHLRKLIVIETPAELKGSHLYLELPSPGRAGDQEAPSPPVFGSDFSVADLAAEQLPDQRYEMTGGVDLERVPHHVVRALPRVSARTQTAAAERLLYLRKDNLYISRIDYVDREGQLIKRLSFRAPRPDDSGAWRAGMMLMENLKEGSRSLLRIDRRVESPDYTPETVFAGLNVSRP